MDPDHTDVSDTSGKLIAFGPTSTGKYLACVYEEFEDWIYPITAFEV